jgi:hypothetical protein
VSVLLFELVERHIVTGPHIGPVEPVMISLGGASLAGRVTEMVTWSRDVFVLGAVFGGVAGAVSGNALLRTISSSR